MAIFFILSLKKKIDKTDGGAGTDAGIGSVTSNNGKNFAISVSVLAPALWIFRHRCRRRLQPIFSVIGPVSLEKKQTKKKKMQHFISLIRQDNNDHLLLSFLSKCQSKQPASN